MQSIDAATGRRALQELFRTRSLLGPLTVLYRRIGRVFQIPLSAFHPYVVGGPEANRQVLVSERGKLRWRNPDPVTGVLRRGVLGDRRTVFQPERLLLIWSASLPVKPGGSASLSGWVKFLAYVTAFLALALGLRWLRRKLMWRLRNRLIVTYVFIGVIPVILLLSIGLITAYLFANSEPHEFAAKGPQAIVTLLVDGIPFPGGKLPKAEGHAITQMLKLLAGLDVKERKAAQAGGIKAEFDSKGYTLSVKSAPVPDGERLTVRMADSKIKLDTPQDLGMGEAMRATLRPRGVSLTIASIGFVVTPLDDSITSPKPLRTTKPRPTV